MSAPISASHAARFQAPQPLRLRRRQAKSGHLDVFAPNTLKDAFKRLILCWLRQCSPVFLK
jgi:hypothetical protein